MALRPQRGDCDGRSLKGDGPGAGAERVRVIQDGIVPVSRIAPSAQICAKMEL